MHAIASSRSASLGPAWRLLAALWVLVIVFPSTAGAVSVANKDLALSLLLELGANDVELAGCRIQQVDAHNKAQVAQCFANVRDIVGRAVNNEIEAQSRLPAGIRRQPSMWAPLVSAAHLAYGYATNAPGIQYSNEYQAMKYIEAARRNAEALLRTPGYREMMKAMGMDVDALKQWGDEETKRNLRTMINLVC